MRFTPFPKLETARLVLRQLKNTDTVRIFRLRSDPAVLQHLHRKPTKTADEAAFFIRDINRGNAKDEWIYWGVSLKESGELIGICCLWNIDWEIPRAEIGYELLPEHQGKGLMSEAVQAALRYGFEEINLLEIIAVLSPENLKSKNLLKKHRFSRNKAFKLPAGTTEPAGTISYILKRKTYQDT